MELPKALKNVIEEGRVTKDAADCGGPRRAGWFALDRSQEVANGMSNRRKARSKKNPEVIARGEIRAYQ